MTTEMRGSSQQARKLQERVIVRRLTVGAGSAALGLAWYFTASATSAAPLALGAQAADTQPVVGVEQMDDHVFVRTAHVTPAPAPSTRATTAKAPAGAPAAAPAATPVAVPVAVTVVPAPAPTKPAATTGGSTPPK